MTSRIVGATALTSARPPVLSIHAHDQKATKSCLSIVLKIVLTSQTPGGGHMLRPSASVLHSAGVYCKFPVNRFRGEMLNAQP